jgi:quercetin dioxygenase-like cupin family protein
VSRAEEATLVPELAGSPLALSRVQLESGTELALHAPEHDSLLYVVAGSGSVSLGDEEFVLERGCAALVLAGEDARIATRGGHLALLRATVGPETDRHALLGARETVVSLDETRSQEATGARSYQVLFGPHNGSTRATLFAGFIPPGAAPWHFHLYDEIVWVPEGPGLLRRRGGEETLGAGSAFRLGPREVHILENSSPDRELTILGLFTPAGSPSAAYLAVR